MLHILPRSSATSTKKKLSRLTAPILVNSAEVEIIRALRRQGCISRGEISNITGWSKAKASHEIRRLVDKVYLLKVGEWASQRGTLLILISIYGRQRSLRQ